MCDGEDAQGLYHHHLHDYKQCSKLFHVSFVSLPFHPPSNKTDATQLCRCCTDGTLVQTDFITIGKLLQLVELFTVQSDDV